MQREHDLMWNRISQWSRNLHRSSTASKTEIHSFHPETNVSW